MNQSIGLDVFKDYCGIKVHFNEWGFNWNPDRSLNLNAASFVKRKDKSFFYRLAEIKKGSRPEWIEYLISGFMGNRHSWIGDLFDDYAEDRHAARMKNRRALGYHFRVDAENIKNHLEQTGMPFTDLLKVGRSQPRIFEERVAGGITEESLAILDYFFGFTRQETENMLWSETRLKINKYSRLLNIGPQVDLFKPQVDFLISQHK